MKVAIVIGSFCLLASAQGAKLTPLEKAMKELHSQHTIKVMTGVAPDAGFHLLDFSEEPFAKVFEKSVAEKPALIKKQLDLLNERYDLSNTTDKDGITMTRGKPIQVGVRVRLPQSKSWNDLNALTPEEIKKNDLFPKGFLSLPHPKHFEGGMVFPKMHINELKKQTGRDLARFDLDFDIPEHFLPEFPAAIFLTTRKDLGDVSQGQLLTSDNFFEIMDDKLTHKQTDGLRLLLTPFSQQQFNLTSDRRSERPSLGVTCFDCHQNGHSNGGTHLVGDTKPNAFRNRVDTPSLRGVSIQRLFGSQRVLKSVEDFTEFEQRGAYFDGNPDDAIRKGINPLDRATQVMPMAEFQELLDFPPAPKLDVEGRLIEAKASPSEIRGEKLFFGKAKCASCHSGPFYTDLTAHDLQLERFFNSRLVDGVMVKPDGPIKTFPLRGIKDSPPYLHDGRLLTLDDTVEFFNTVLQTKLTAEEKRDIVAFMKVL